MLFIFDVDHGSNCVGDIVGGGFDDGHLNITMRGQLVGGKIYSNSGSPDGCKGLQLTCTTSM